MNRENQSGFSVLSVVLATAILVSTLFAVLSGLAHNRKTSLYYQRRVAADALGAELLEFFASLTPADMRNFMTQGSTSDWKTYCTQYNLLDRSVTPAVLRRPDPVAALNDVAALGGVNAQANRSYMIQIVTLSPTSVVVQNAACGKKFNQYVIQEKEAFLVSVEVTWLRDGALDRALVSTIVPIPQ